MTDIAPSIETLFAENAKEVEMVVRQIHSHPELSENETLACERQAAQLQSWGFSVETGYKKLPTAFKASAGQGRPHICFMSEYDALPGMGHGCGHNLIAGVALGAGMVLKKLLEQNQLPGTVTVMGTPAEEQRGAKIDLIREGALKDVDIVLMAHPTDDYTTSYAGESGIIQMKVSYKGQTSHAADAPEKGLNALDAVRLMFNGVDAWRQQLSETSRIHGVIKDGGLAPNIIPGYAEAEFYLRDFNLSFLSHMRTRFENIAKGAALMTDTVVKIEEIPNSYKPGRPNEPLNNLFMALAQEAHMSPQSLAPSRGSSDFGDVTYEVPAMHAYFNITKGDEDIVIHSKEFAKCAITPFALSQMRKTACILAQIAWVFITKKNFRKKVQDAFQHGKKSQPVH